MKMEIVVRHVAMERKKNMENEDEMTVIDELVSSC